VPKILRATFPNAAQLEFKVLISIEAMRSIEKLALVTFWEITEAGGFTGFGMSSSACLVVSVV
jgi:hypothetical protein